MTISHGGAEPFAAEHRTVSRVVAILEMVVASEPRGLRLGDIPAPISAPKSSVHGLTKGLVAVGYLREQDGRYFTGPALHSLLSPIGRLTVPATHLQAITDLTADWGETSYIAMLVGDSLVHVERVEAPHAVRALPAVNTRFPLWPRSAGKCLLAFMDRRRQEAYLHRSFAESADRDRVRNELARIRDAKVGLNLGETEADQCGVASPILIGSSPVTMAIGLSGPLARMRPHLGDIVEAVQSAAAALSNRS